jgi:hypothetical protein
VAAWDTGELWGFDDGASGHWTGLLSLVAVMVVVVAYLVYAHDPESASTLVRTLVGLATTACTVAGWLWARRRPVQVSRLQLERVADELTEQVYRQWERAAGERRLVYPAPMCLRWQWSRRQVRARWQRRWAGSVGHG